MTAPAWPPEARCETCRSLRLIFLKQENGKRTGRGECERFRTYHGDRIQYDLDHGKPDLVVAFPGGSGTADMVRRAEAAGLTIRDFR